MSVDYSVKAGDAGKRITATVTDADGSPTTIAGASVRFLMASARTGTQKVAAAAENYEDGAGTTGQVRYQWQADDLDAPDLYLAEWEITYAGGEIETFPSEGYSAVLVTGDLDDSAPAATYDPATDRGRVRLLLGDTAVEDAATRIFTDAEIAAFLAMGSGVVELAAARALRAIAASEVYVQKRIKLLDLQTDGPAEAEALRKLADDVERVYEEGGDFDWAELVYDDFSARERLWNEVLRGG